MFTAKVYKICIASAGGALQEVHIAQDTVAKWNCQRGEECGAVFLQVPKDASPDVYVFVIDNYVDKAIVESAIETGNMVFLFFSTYHDQNNTMGSVIQAIKGFRGMIKDKCSCLDYDTVMSFEANLLKRLENYLTA